MYPPNCRWSIIIFSGYILNTIFNGAKLPILTSWIKFRTKSDNFFFKFYIKQKKHHRQGETIGIS